MTSPLRLENTSTRPARLSDGTEVTTHSRSLIVRLPFAQFRYTRPIGATIDRAGRREQVQIVDYTRRAQVILLGIAILVTVFGIIGVRPTDRKERQRHERRR